ncbi:HAD-IIIC family phosphatase [Mycobacterium senriense]|uniref:Haloacid dehalogenase n=1 Tax=Mycobacterium senriense TaxID=2775496 RepID=A0ABM7SUC3_9MYCO|nr:HAD-IIIC family phosphatase [Mycobacterium senriense]BCZ24960.1 haloacid dehalogenase [Mycobacterium senriense]
MSVTEGQYLLEQFHRQEILTAPRPRRAEVTALKIDEPVKLQGTVAVWRNHAIEPLQPLLDPFLLTAGLDLELALGGYDDTLALTPCSGAEIDLIWYDLDRLTLDDDEALDWFVSRVTWCAASAAGPVLVVPISDKRARVAAVVERLENLPGVHCANPLAVCDEAGVILIDERTAALTGSRISRDAQVQLARALGTHWLPATMLPPLKMVAVDLDETLHQGVLGEDGIEGVIVSDAHARLHGHLKELAASGVLLALISRNEPEDVERLFATRKINYGLALEDFFTVEVSWGSKADAVRRAAARARIGKDAVVFVDDNPGELLTVGLRCAGVSLILAQADADRTVNALRWHPGLWRWSTDDAAAIRAGDLAANVAREELLQGAVDFDRYLEELGVRAEVGIDREEQLTRLADLSAKTNQFNLAVARLNESDLQRAMRDEGAYVISVALSDRLSNSGVIALVLVRKDGDRLRVDELAMSCRAMGRGLESILVTQALKALPCWEEVREVCFQVRRTDRNTPARRWLTDIVGLEDKDASTDEVIVDRIRFDKVLVPDAVVVSVLGPSADHG